MLLTCVSKSDPGPVRKNNEDYIGFWQPGDVEERLKRGAIMVMADGVGGQDNGEIASRMTVNSATFPRSTAARRCGSPRSVELLRRGEDSNLRGQSPTG